MKRLLLAVAVLLLAGAAQAQIWVSVPAAWVRMDGGDPAPGGGSGTGAPDDADYLVGTAHADLSAEIAVGTTPGGELGGTWASPTVDDGISITNLTMVTPILGTPQSGTLTNTTGFPAASLAGLGAGVATWLATATSANLRGALSDETGTGFAVFSDTPNLTTPDIKNGATSGGYARFHEDSDNGVNYVQVRAPSAITANYTLTPPQPGSDAELGLQHGRSQVYLHDELICGGVAAAAVTATCQTWTISNTNTTWAGVPDGSTTAPGVIRMVADSATDVGAWATTNDNSILMMDGFRWRARMQVNQVSTDTSTYGFFVGAHDASLTNTNAPGNGAWFSYTDTVPSVTPNWTINVGDTGADATADCGIALTAAAFHVLDIKFETGVGVHFYVDDVECSNSPINTELPTAAGEEFRWFEFKGFQTVGTGPIQFDFDYVTLGPTPIVR